MKVKPSQEVRLFQAMALCRQMIVDGEDPAGAAALAGHKYEVDREQVLSLALDAIRGKSEAEQPERKLIRNRTHGVIEV